MTADGPATSTGPENPGFTVRWDEDDPAPPPPIHGAALPDEFTDAEPGHPGAPDPAHHPVPAGATEFADVYLLTTGPDGPTAVAGLRLRLDEVGATVTKPDRSLIWSAPWSDIAQLATPERSTLPDGEPGVVLVVTPRSGRPHRFVIPASEAGVLEEAIESTAHVFGVTVPPAVEGPGRLVTGVVVALVAVAVAAILLVAGHVVSL